MIHEELLKQAAQQASIMMIESVTDDQIEEHEFSRDFEVKMTRFLRRKRQPMLWWMTRVAASVLLMVVLSGSAMLMLSSEARAAFSGWVRQTFGPVTTYYGGEYGQAHLDSFRYELTAVPEKYTISEQINEPGRRMVVYSDEEGRMLVFSYVADSENTVMMLMPNGSKPKQTSVYGNQADVYITQYPNYYSHIVWEDGRTGVLLMITGCFSEKELVELAESALDSIE